MLLTALGLLALGAPPAAAATRLVDDDRGQCPFAPYRTVQAGVDAAQPSDTVIVCEGSYREDVTVGGGFEDGPDKAGVRILSQVRHGATVRGFALQDDRLEVSGLVIDGGGVSLEEASARMLDNRIRGGVGLFRAGAEIRRNAITGYRGTGVSVGPGSDAQVVGGTLEGGPGSTGITVAGGIFAAPSDQVANATVFGNRIIGNGVAGIVGGFRGGLLIRGNVITGNGVGLTLNNASAFVQRNTIRDNRAQGALVLNDTGATFTTNDLRGNGGVDCDDRTTGSGTAGTASEWRFNRGSESSPPGLCRP